MGYGGGTSNMMSQMIRHHKRMASGLRAGKYIHTFAFYFNKHLSNV